MASGSTNKESRQFVIRVPHKLDEQIEEFITSQRGPLKDRRIHSRSSLWRAAVAEFMERWDADPATSEADADAAAVNPHPTQQEPSASTSSIRALSAE